MLANKKAISTLILIILLLCSAVLGAIVSYLWVMADYYMEPQNMVDLVITEVNFPVNHADYFYVTVMNPTHSVSETNITEIYFTVEDDNIKHNVTKTSPEELPIKLERGTTKTIECFPEGGWGEFAGKTITVHVLTMNASGAAYSFKTEFVKLYVDAYFNATESIQYFNLTVRNDEQSKINLTLNEVYLGTELITNTSITLGETIVPINETIEFRCYYDWQGYSKPTVTVMTLEGYIFKTEKSVPSTAKFSVIDVKFNETNPTALNVTLQNSPDSETLVDVVNITLTGEGINETDIAVFDPPVRINKNETVTLNCVWNWTEYRDKNVTINAYTKQGFKADSKTVKTPSPVILKITALDFNLVDTGRFSVSVQNMPCSIQEANITKFRIFYDADFTEIEGTAVSPSLPQSLAINGTQLFNCTFNWTAYEGSKINVTVYTPEGFNATYTHTLPKVLLNVDFDRSKSTNYFSITVQNNAYTTINLTEIYVNETLINASITYPVLPASVEDGQSIIIVCPFEWQSLSENEVTIRVKTENGFDIITTTVIP